ncbi:hypothetical protein ACFVAJ_19030 [Agromyces sp. NPDC057679]|uniref:hypothetical protein n=1 Tax=Agromyces sp. NPDC057679 TaxID=3346207 RepID=UPI003672BDA6
MSPEYLNAKTIDQTGRGHQKTGQWANKTQTPAELSLHAAPDLGGYDEVIVDEYGTTRYMKAGAPHREDGPAIVFKSGDSYHALNGDHVGVPGDDSRFQLLHVTDGNQFWRYTDEDGLDYDALVEPDGKTTFMKDGSYHRAGDPAVIYPDGSEEWWVDGTFYEVFPGGGRPTEDPDGMYPTRFGAKYTEWRSVTEISKDLRKDFELARRAGVFPPHLTISVRSEKYSGGQSINVTVDGLTDAEIYTEDPRYPGERRYTELVGKMKDRLERITKQYNRSRTNSMVDYFDESYYSSVTIHDERATAFWAREKEAAKARRLAAAERRKQNANG